MNNRRPSLLSRLEKHDIARRVGFGFAVVLTAAVVSSAASLISRLPSGKIEPCELLFPQIQMAERGPQEWKPEFTDYPFLAFNMNNRLQSDQYTRLGAKNERADDVPVAHLARRRQRPHRAGDQYVAVSKHNVARRSQTGWIASCEAGHEDERANKDREE